MIKTHNITKTITKIKTKKENVTIKLIQNVNKNYNSISIIAKYHCPKITIGLFWILSFFVFKWVSCICSPLQMMKACALKPVGKINRFIYITLFTHLWARNPTPAPKPTICK